MSSSSNETANRRRCFNGAADYFGLMEAPFHPPKELSA